MKIKKLVAALLLISGSVVTYAQNKGPIKIGFITDGASLYSDIDGIGGKEAMEMAIADFGGTVNGKKIDSYQCTRNKKYGMFCGLHYNRKSDFVPIETFVQTNKKHIHLNL